MITDTEIKVNGLKALAEALGQIEAERFISLLMREPFDYTNWQKTLWPEGNVQDISEAAMDLRRDASDES